MDLSFPTDLPNIGDLITVKFHHEGNDGEDSIDAIIHSTVCGRVRAFPNFKDGEFAYTRNLIFFDLHRTINVLLSGVDCGDENIIHLVYSTKDNCWYVYEQWEWDEKTKVEVSF